VTTAAHNTKGQPTAQGVLRRAPTGGTWHGGVHKQHVRLPHLHAKLLHYSTTKERRRPRRIDGGGGGLGFETAAALVSRVPGERGKVGGGGSSYRRPGSPRRAGPREEARVCSRRGGVVRRGRVQLGLGLRKAMTVGPHLAARRGGEGGGEGCAGGLALGRLGSQGGLRD
jgi:hypothetical protein